MENKMNIWNRLKGSKEWRRVLLHKQMAGILLQKVKWVTSACCAYSFEWMGRP